ncbi:MAG: TRAP transporter small permease [Thermodesulfobacteriota bacterium]
MDGILNAVRQLSRFLNVVAGVSITFIIILTMADVIMRTFRRPIVGTYELVAFTGAVVIGFALPFTSWMRGHIYVDFVVQKLPKMLKAAFHIATRCAGIGLFYLIARNLINVGMDLQKSGEVSPTLQLPFYYVAYAVAFSCFVQCFVLLCDIVKVWRGEYE